MEWADILDHETPTSESLPASPRPCLPPPEAEASSRKRSSSKPRRVFSEQQILDFGRNDPGHTFVAGIKTLVLQHMCLRGDARQEVEEKIVDVLDTVLASEQPPPGAHEEAPAVPGGDASAEEGDEEEASTCVALSLDDILAASPRPPACDWSCSSRAASKAPRLIRETSCLKDVLEGDDESEAEISCADCSQSRKKARKMHA